MLRRSKGGLPPRFACRLGGFEVGFGEGFHDVGLTFDDLPDPFAGDTEAAADFSL